jgi:2-polyprenyl-6-methoxyphenol hydroxylase-like FAD-dependent oxidoreductase
MFVTQFVAQKRCADPATGYADLRAPDLEDHVFWALIAKREKFGTTHDLRHKSATELQDLVLGMIHDWDPNLRRLVMESDPPSFTAISLQSADAIPTWETTNVTLLGDAIHTMTPLQGLGGNTALRDAQSLCRTLLEVGRDPAGLLDGLRKYETDMRVYGDEAVRVSLRYTQSFVSDSRFERAAFEAVLKAADAIPPLKRRMFQATRA